MITVKFGAGNSITRDINGYETVEDVLNDQNVQGILGFGDNVDTYIGGVPAPARTTLTDGDVITLVTKANTKA